MTVRGRMNRMLEALSLMLVGCVTTVEEPAGGACTPDEVLECACADGEVSTQVCLPSGDGLGPCQCEGNSGGGAAVGTGGSVYPGGSTNTGGSLPGLTGGTSSGGAMPTGGSGGTSTGGVPEIPLGGSGGIGAGADGVGGSAGGSDGEPPPPPLGDHCLDGITNYTTDGPFTYTTSTSGQVKFWVPNVPAGCKVPIVHLANGTGATCSTYGAILQHLASHGFLTTCYENTNTGQGTQCLTAIQTALSEYPDLADNKVGSTGHSQGGGGAIMCVYRAEQEFGDEITIVGHAMEPAHGYGDSPANYATYYGQIRSPIFMFNGSSDGLVSATWVGQGFSALDDTVEAYWYEAIGAAHIPIPTRWTEESTVAWFRWKLLGDSQACEYFKNMPNTADWDLQGSQSETGCN
jgi:hypothetical protein